MSESNKSVSDRILYLVGKIAPMIEERSIHEHQGTLAILAQLFEARRVGDAQARAEAQAEALRQRALGDDDKAKAIRHELATAKQ